MCDQRERLMDYLYEEATPADRRVVEAHLEACGDCREEIRAFRRVREDLLAWEVPNAESVWTPFAPQPVMPWHRQIPAWAMAAAAGVMIMFGSAGGFAAATLFTGASAASTAQGVVAPLEQVARVEPDSPTMKSCAWCVAKRHDSRRAAHSRPARPKSWWPQRPASSGIA